MDMQEQGEFDDILTSTEGQQLLEYLGDVQAVEFVDI